MLDDDVIVTKILLNCGCLLIYKHYMSSGIHYDNKRDHIKAKFKLDINKDSIRDFHNDTDKLRTLMDTMTVEKLCAWHTEEAMTNILINIDKYYEIEKEKMKKYDHN